MCKNHLLSGFTLMEIIICVGVIALMSGIWALKYKQTQPHISEQLEKEQLLSLNRAIDSYQIRSPNSLVFIGDNSDQHNQKVLDALLQSGFIQALPKNMHRIRSSSSGEHFRFYLNGEEKPLQPELIQLPIKIKTSLTLLQNEPIQPTRHKEPKREKLWTLQQKSFQQL